MQSTTPLATAQAENLAGDEEAIQLIALAYRINRKNMRKFAQRLDRLADVGRELRAGRLHPDAALEIAEQLGFICPLAQVMP